MGTVVGVDVGDSQQPLVGWKGPPRLTGVTAEMAATAAMAATAPGVLVVTVGMAARGACREARLPRDPPDLKGKSRTQGLLASGVLKEVQALELHMVSPASSDGIQSSGLLGSCFIVLIHGACCAPWINIPQVS